MKDLILSILLIIFLCVLFVILPYFMMQKSEGIIWDYFKRRKVQNAFLFCPINKDNKGIREFGIITPFYAMQIHGYVMAFILIFAITLEMVIFEATNIFVFMPLRVTLCAVCGYYLLVVLFIVLISRILSKTRRKKFEKSLQQGYSSMFNIIKDDEE